MKAADKKARDEYLKKLAFARQAGEANPFETEDEKNQRIERAKKDYRFMLEYYFPHYATVDCADFHVDLADEVKNDPYWTGFVEWGRGLAKSVECDIGIPFYLWLNGEPVYLVIVGYNEKRGSQLLEDLRAEFEANPKIIADFGEQRQLGSWEDTFFVTNGGFIGQAVGLGQSCRGLRVKNQRPTLIVPDDTETRKNIKNERIQDELVEWVEQELLPTMDGEQERLMIANNWFAKKMYIKKLAERHPDWKRHTVKAYDPTTYKPAWIAKYSESYYRNKEKKMGRTSALAEYNHVAKMQGKIFNEKLIQWAKLPHLNHFAAIVAHWDIAYAGNPTSDYNAVRIWGLYRNDFYLIDCFVKQTKMKPAVRWTADKHRNRPETVTIHLRAESQFWNGEVKRTIKEIEEEEGLTLPITLVDTPKTKKIDRILQGLEALYQNGRIYYNEQLKSHADTQEGLQQLFGIEPGYNGHDDAPDADEQAISYLTKFITLGKKKRKPKVGRVKSKNVI